MLLQIKCPTCHKILVEVEKDEISRQDEDMYIETVSCDEHGKISGVPDGQLDPDDDPNATPEEVATWWAKVRSILGL